MIEQVKAWKKAHPDLWEFILFNILSNCATVTNFVVLWLTTGICFAHLTQPFRWFIFDYSAPGSGGLGGFLGFLVAYVCAQIVNYIVQRKLVFGATVANVINIILQVVINYPMMKFVIMKKD